MQNAEEHTHGFVAPDLGMGAMRNSVILAQVLGPRAYAVEKRIAFQECGIPDRYRDRPATEQECLHETHHRTPRPDPRPRHSCTRG